MKFIGQHIHDLISRFRNDVYLESVSESAQDHVVGIDASGKLYKQDVIDNILNYSLLTCTGTVTSSATDGEANAVVIPYDTEQLTSSSNTIILTGSGLAGVSSSANSWYMTTQGDYEFQWNVLTNTNTVNNRILSGVKLQRGTSDGSSITWADYNPSVSFIYDRGTGSIRKGSTTNQTLVTQASTQYYWRLMCWKEESSTATTESITVITGVSCIVKQIS
tara:strand:+ start:805 stop:1464 length:660 start_codon:yes stop_codon:yes gene_type:complete